MTQYCAPCRRSATSRHASSRQQQRSIPQVVIDALFEFGEASRTPDGHAWRHIFGKRGWRRFSAWIGPAASHFERYRRAYLVTGADGTLITVAWDWHRRPGSGKVGA